MNLILKFAGASFIIGAIFVLVDISSDAILFIEYINDDRLPMPVFGLFTGIWIGLGAIVQCGVAVFLTIRGDPNGPFKSLPLRIRVFILFTSPILLSPVVVNVYGAYLVIRNGIADTAMKKISMIAANLKFAEVIFESAPQLLTQWTIIFYETELRRNDLRYTYV